MNGSDSALAQSFDAVAIQYEAVRPSYPRRIITDIITQCRLHVGETVLEIGAGSGKATELLLEKGLDLVCVEPGEKLVKILRNKFEHLPAQRLRIVESKFEDFLTDERFDAIIAAQAAHWLDPLTRLSRPYELLKPGGSLIFLWNMSPKMESPFFVELYKIYDSIAGGMREPSFVDSPSDYVTVPAGEELLRSQLFRDVNVIRESWTATYTTESFLTLLSTFSNHQLLELHTKSKLFAAIKDLCASFGGVIEKKYLAIAYVGQRSG